MGCAIKNVEVKNLVGKSNLPVGEFSVNPYMGCEHGCRYCYASYMRRFTKHQESWGDWVDVKYWPKIQNPNALALKGVVIGSVTDPYQPAEATYRRTRTALEDLLECGCNITIITKSDLVTRDMDLIRQFPDAEVAFSINTLDEVFRAEMDRAASIQRRIEAMETLYDAHIRTACFISPIFPGITNVIDIIERVNGGCNSIWLENLNLRGEQRPNVFRYIEQQKPNLVPLYDEIYRRNNRSYWSNLDQEVKEYAARHVMPYVRDDNSVRQDFGAPPAIVNYFYHEEIKRTAKEALLK